MNMRNHILLVWDYALETITYTIDLAKSLNLSPGNCVSHICPTLSNLKSGLLVVDAEGYLYDVSLSGK